MYIYYCLLEDDKSVYWRLQALYKHSYSIQFFRMKTLMMGNSGRNM